MSDTKPPNGHALEAQQSQPDRAAINRAVVNKANAQHSTGPRTTAGKQRSSRNALRHGLTGHVVVLPAEDHNAYQRHVQRFVAQFQPKGALEEQLVQSLSDTTWRLNRVPALETNFLTLGIEEHLETIRTNHPEAADALAMASALHTQSRTLANLSIYEQRIARFFDRTLKQLREIQVERQEKERTQMIDAAKLLNLHELRNVPFDPKQDGFVFSTSEIEAFIGRRDRLLQAYRAPERAFAAIS